MKSKLNNGLWLLVLVALFSCHGKETKKQVKKTVFRGLYSFGPEAKSFKDCGTGREYWAADSSAKLELAYSQLNFEKPYTPVYVEVEGRKVKSDPDGMGSEFDSTLVVTRLIKITKDIPAGMCQ